MKNSKLLKVCLLSVFGVTAFSLAISPSFKVTTDSASAAVSTPSTTYKNGDADTYYNDISTSATGETLLSALRSLNLSRRKSTVGYGAMGTSPSGMFRYTDYDPATVKYDDNGQPYGTAILSFYSGKSTNGWNREHVWPNSHGGGSGGSAGNPYPDADIFMPRPTITAENSNRGNSFYVEGMSHSSNGWDPWTAFGDSMGCYNNEGIRGECARIIFYCTTVNANLRLECNNVPTTYSSGVSMGNLIDLLKWNLEYPVNQRELNRQEGGEYLQGNRNAFVDHPEYACKIWGDTNKETQSICSKYAEPPTKITLSSEKTTIAVDGKTTISVGVDKGSSLVNWSTSDSKVATVDNNGVVTGIGMGSATITATSALDSNVKGTIKINVKGVTGLSKSGTLTKTTYTAGQSFNPSGLTITATYSDSSTDDVTSLVTWAPEKLTEGLTSVTGVYGGKTIVVDGITVEAAPVVQGYTIKFKDKGSDGSSAIDANAISKLITEGADYVSSISNVTRIYEGKTGLKAGSGSGTGTLTINLSDAGKTNCTGIKVGVAQYNTDTQSVKVATNFDSAGKTIEFTGTGVVEVDTGLSGNVTSITVGSGSKRVYISYVKVETSGGTQEDVPVTSVSLNKGALNLEVGDVETLTATVYPANATNKTVTWTSSDEKVATVSNGVVSAIAEGDATITAKAGDKTAACVVHVENEEDVPTLESITISGQKTKFAVGDTFTFGGTVTAHYSNSTTADVTSKATFTGYNMANEGTQTVTVSYGGKTATYSITVSAQAATLESISISGQKVEFTIGDTFSFDGKVTATYSDGSTEDVTSNATFTGYDLSKEGKQTVTVTYEGKTATYEITVKKANQKKNGCPGSVVGASAIMFTVSLLGFGLLLSKKFVK